MFTVYNFEMKHLCCIFIFCYDLNELFFNQESIFSNLTFFNRLRSMYISVVSLNI